MPISFYVIIEGVEILTSSTLNNTWEYRKVEVIYLGVRTSDNLLLVYFF